jgi:hypothetical protein
VSEVSEDSRRSSISFGSIVVREFNRIIGDHPDVSSGPPLSIGWEYSQNEPVPVDEYEKNKDSSHGPPERTTKFERILLLHQDYGFSLQELKDAETKAKRAKKRRAQSSERHSKISEYSESMRLAIARGVNRVRKPRFYDRKEAGGGYCKPPRSKITPIAAS